MFVLLRIAVPGEGWGRSLRKISEIKWFMSWGLKTRRHSTGRLRSKGSIGNVSSVDKAWKFVFGASCWLSIKFCMLQTFPILSKSTNPSLTLFNFLQHHRNPCELADFSFWPPLYLSIYFFHLLPTNLRNYTLRNHKFSPPADFFVTNPLLLDHPFPLYPWSYSPLVFVIFEPSLNPSL